MTVNHQALVDIALAYRKKLPNNSSYGISELLKFPKFFDWVDCRLSESSVSFKMYLAGADDGVALRFFWNGCYEKATLNLWGGFVRRGGIIIDIGAHTGAYTLAAFAVDPNARVISFEPHFMNFARLNMNLRGNGCSGSDIHMLGVGEEGGTLPFSVATDVSYLTSGGSIGARENAIVTNIQVVSLDQCLPDPTASEINLIKIDTEGHEGACLRGMVNVIQNSRPVIFLECINGESGSAVTSILKSMNYQFFIIDDVTGMIYPVNDISPQTDASGYLVKNRLNRIAVPNQEAINYMQMISSLST